MAESQEGIAMLAAKLAKHRFSEITAGNVGEMLACFSGVIFDLIANQGKWFGIWADVLIVAGVAGYIFAYFVQHPCSPRLYRFIRWAAFACMAIGMTAGVAEVARQWWLGLSPS